MANGTHLSGFGINVTDLDRSVEFYTNALGLEEKTKIDLGELHEVLVGGDDDRSAILLVKHADRTDAPDAGQRVREDRARHRRRRRALRARHRAGRRVGDRSRATIEQMGMKVALVRDPDGYLIELVEQRPG